MSTDSTVNLLQQFRRQILTAETPSGAHVSDYLGADVKTARLYVHAAPDGAAYPYGVMRLIGVGAGWPGRMTATLELMLFHRPRARLPEAETIADLCVSAMWGLRQSASGLVIAREYQRATLEAVPEPGDIELVQIRLAFPFYAYPQFLTHVA